MRRAGSCRLPGTADRVGHAEVDLGAVERAVARVDACGPARVRERAAERRLPLSHCASPPMRFSGRAERSALTGSPNVPYTKCRELEEGEDLGLDLLDGGRRCARRPARWGGRASGRASRQRARTGARGPARRAASGGPGSCAARRRRSGSGRTVHRLEPEALGLRLGEVHVLSVVVVVAGDLEELGVEEHRRPTCGSPRSRSARARTPSARSRSPCPSDARMASRRHVGEAEEVELCAEPAMVAGARLPRAVQVLLELPTC